MNKLFMFMQDIIVVGFFLFNKTHQSETKYTVALKDIYLVNKSQLVFQTVSTARAWTKKNCALTFKNKCYFSVYPNPDLSPRSAVFVFNLTKKNFRHGPIELFYEWISVKEKNIKSKYGFLFYPSLINFYSNSCYTDHN